MSAFCSMSASPSSEHTSNGLSVRVRYGTRVDRVRDTNGLASGSAAGAAARWLFRHGDSLDATGVGVVGIGRSGRSRAASGATGGRGRFGALGKGHERSKVRGRSDGVGEGHGMHEQFLEARFGRRLDLCHPTYSLFNFCTEGLGQERTHGAGTGGVAHRPNARERTVGNQAQHHGVERVDVRTEGTSQTDVAYLRKTGVFEEKVNCRPGVPPWPTESPARRSG